MPVRLTTENPPITRNRKVTAASPSIPFGKFSARNPEIALSEELGEKSRSEIQQELDLVVALRDVSFEVSPGETFVVMGLSGSGKSTLVRCLIRLVEPTSGSISVDGEEVTAFDSRQLRDFRRSKIAMVFQNFGLLPP